MDILVAYDIDTTTREGERRLSRVAAVCESYGIRRQYSVFECRLSATRVERFKCELLDIIEAGVDTIDIYRFPGKLSDQRETLGIRKSADPGSGWIV